MTERRPETPSATEPALSGLDRVGIALAVIAALLALVGGRTVDSDRVDGYGLLFALPPIYWIAIALASAATGLLLFGALIGRKQLAIGVPALWLIVAHTAPALAHSYARFSIVYIHLGFIRLIENEGTGDILVDARFAWPGFFGAFVPSLAEINPTVLDWLMRLWPTLILGASAILVAALARRSYPNRPMIGPMSSTVFVLLSWTGQGYFSPQSLGFFFYLSIIIVLESGPMRPRGAWSSAAPILSRFATAGGDRPEARSTGSFVALLLLSFGTVVSHPLAPFFVCGALVMLAFYGRSVAWRLVLIVGVVYVVWVIVAAEPWWSTRVEELSGQFGSFFSNFRSSTSDRVSTSSAEHLVVTNARTIVGLSTFLSVLVMGIVMATERFRYLRPALPLAPLAGIPVLAAAVQSYGGEIIIRVLLFTLPMASILIARLILALPRRIVPAVVALLTAAVMPVFIITRFGNESFEMTRSVDREAVEVMYANTEPGTVLFADNAFLPWGDELRESNDHLYSRAQASEEWLAELRAEAVEAEGNRVLLVLTPSQSAWREHIDSLPPESLDTTAGWLATQPGVEVLYQDGGAWVLDVALDPGAGG